MKTLIVVRTHVLDTATERAIAYLSASSDHPVAVAADERKGVVDLKGVPKVSMTRESLGRLGLHPHQRSGWQCGDYCYYHVQEAFDDFDFYWLVEPDVHFGFEAARDFFGQFTARPEDLLGAAFGERLSHWGWRRAMDPQGTGMPVYGCRFPVTRVSRRAIEVLHAARKAASASTAPKLWRHWPNDEGFVATTLVRAGHACADFNDVVAKPVWSNSTFRTGKPILREEALRDSGAGKLWHPVLEGDKFIEKLRAWRRRGHAIADQRPIVLRYFGQEAWLSIENEPIVHLKDRGYPEDA